MHMAEQHTMRLAVIPGVHAPFVAENLRSGAPLRQAALAWAIVAKARRERPSPTPIDLRIAARHRVRANKLLWIDHNLKQRRTA